MSTYRLHEWSVRAWEDGFTAPELVRLRLAGRRAEDNKRVLTSPVRSANGCAVTTESGSVYVLEDVSPEYVAFLASIGRTLDAKNPIKFVRR